MGTAALVQFNPPAVAAEAVVAVFCADEGLGNIDNEAKPTAIASPKARINHCACLPGRMSFIRKPRLPLARKSRIEYLNHLLSQLNKNVVTKSEQDLRELAGESVRH